MKLAPELSIGTCHNSAPTSTMEFVSVLASVEILPLHAQVALLDASWQDYPEWQDGNEDVAVGSGGFAVATRPDVDDLATGTVRVDVQIDGQPDGMRLVHNGAMTVGAKGILVGNFEAGVMPIELPPGPWAVEIWVDAERPHLVSHVVFVVAPK